MTKYPILYIGPVRIDIQVKYVAGMFCISHNNKVIGYPNYAKEFCFVEYSIGHLNPMLQSMFRCPEVRRKWSGLMVISEHNVWHGGLSLVWESNTVICHLRLVH